jgi:hypothetical protein
MYVTVQFFQKSREIGPGRLFGDFQVFVELGRGGGLP